MLGALLVGALAWAAIVGASVGLVALCGCDGIGPVDRGRMERDGNVLRPMVLPFEVIVSPDVEHADAVTDGLDVWNAATDPLTAFEVRVDGAAFDAAWPLAPEERMGVVLVSEGFAGTPGGMTDAGVSFDDPGGVALLVWNADGEIIAADVTISSDIAYDRQTVRDAAAHEGGHVLGFDHDDSSLDLGSCMASPPEYDCDATEADVATLGE
jgi:hypothetical protein